jgi:uncharacterized protein
LKKALLDINVLIALCDEAHTFHERAWVWFASEQKNGWATCPITEIGFVRIYGSPSNPAGLGSCTAAVDLLRKLCEADGHLFWPDSITIRDSQHFSGTGKVISKSLTNLYLLALATRFDGRFVTFDGKINASLVREGKNALIVI